MQIYLPIAETSVSIYLLLGLGGLVGFLSGMFGVGGGFLMTPLLIFIGIPPTVAVASEANQILASSISGGMAHFQKRGVDIRMGCVLLVSRFWKVSVWYKVASAWRNDSGCNPFQSIQAIFSVPKFLFHLL